MKKILSWLSSPAKRCGIGFLMVLAFGPLGAAVFPPLCVFAIIGVFLFLMWGDEGRVEWFDAAQPADCPKCQEPCPMKMVKIRWKMSLFIPFPILYQLGSKVKITHTISYYRVCATCLEKHVGELDMAAIMKIADGGMAYVEKITEEEFLSAIEKG